ncbi:MAG: acyltransferase [Alphaproteobacteria bacterium]|nr:acyltransferase [Alphaproteobacteria bacterium]
MLKERLIYLDIIRIFACLCILIIHFNASVSGYDIFGYFAYPNHLVPNYYYGCYLGTIGVGLFFLLTGACLQYVYAGGTAKSFSLWNFYKKRWLSLFPGYYIAFFAFTLFSFMWYKAYPDFKIGHLLSSLLGIDGYLMAMRGVGYETYQCGEWFLGCILCLYIIYPPLSWAANKYPKSTAIITMVSYLWLIQSGIKDIWFFLQIPYLLLGIFFIKYFRSALSWKLWIPTLFLFAVRVFAGKYMQPHTIHLITCWLLFLSITLLTELVDKYSSVLKSDKLVSIIAFIGVLTYPLFLVHHKIISIMAAEFDLVNFPYRNTVLLFIVYMMVISIVAYCFYNIEQSFKKQLRKQQ